DLKADAAYAIRQQHGEDNSHNQQHIDERRSLGRKNVALNELGGIARMIDARADECRQDGGREDPDAVGAEILQKPRYRGQNGPPKICAVNQPRPGRFVGTMTTASFWML